MAAQFNDAGVDVDIIVVTYPTYSLGLNLHHKCSDVVSMKPAINSPTQLQASGRVTRIGQKNAQRI
ncbi:hypothetical protein PHISP_05584 [Aspergillus sp. HF37]|nr:hypothetical protein PHISP_05584 [Aspergillus sp. HF37]